VANALIVLTQRALSLLGKQLQSLEAAFLEQGGIRERMTQTRFEARDGDAPACLECGKPMRKRKSQAGEFWPGS
jgi:four helix bundle suffix protein